MVDYVGLQKSMMVATNIYSTSSCYNSCLTCAEIQGESCKGYRMKLPLIEQNNYIDEKTICADVRGTGCTYV